VHKPPLNKHLKHRDDYSVTCPKPFLTWLTSSAQALMEPFKSQDVTPTVFDDIPKSTSLTQRVPFLATPEGIKALQPL